MPLQRRSPGETVTDNDAVWFDTRNNSLSGFTDKLRPAEPDFLALPAAAVVNRSVQFLKEANLKFSLANF